MSATTPEGPRRITPPLLLAKKYRHEKIVCLTANDYPLARILDEAGLDLLLAGDSLGMTRLGYQSTLPVTLSEMLIHLKAARRAVTRALLVADLPFGSYQVDTKSALESALVLVKEGGAEAVKLEGGHRYARRVEHLVAAGIPVMGHIGLLPQSVRVMGGYKVQGKTSESAEALLRDALALQRAGAFALVLEGMAQEVAREITQALEIPTIGIGAGIHCDGQILVTEDLLGLGFGRKPRFVRQYLNLTQLVSNAVRQFKEDCAAERFPSTEEAYHADNTLDPVLAVNQHADR
ncbi:MAG: 3-methyl-2-oxobutanoate hydroxymethyltransferase [Acidobacteria bacterium]|nr:3-methyl-2-oxobutanoate hydroxymethyltransferase [Acidobacteriota bacterium]MCI0620982.1 3-methyl-2-oxobutanoate hydroxymethyltransferase [Acidobacteriota bacterium]MCI0719896.1 3-methyl-2-oxobutanoate hydroxymethyltransferase [Acidobacteriota bacterium]